MKIYCEQIVDVLADVHARRWETLKPGTEVAQPPMAEVTELRQLTEQTYPEFVDFPGRRHSMVRRKVYETVRPSLSALLSGRFAEEKTITLAQGDIHMGSFLYRRKPRQATGRILDWKR